MSIKDCNLSYLRALTDNLNDRDEELKKRDELVQLVFDNCPAGLVIWAVDKNLIFTLSEGRGLKNLGIKEGQSIGKSLYEYFDTVDDNFEPIKHHIKAFEGTPVRYDYEHLGRVWHTHCTPVFNKKNKVIGVTGCAFDITEYVEQQKKIEKLEKIIKDRETCSQDKMELIRKLV
tara:strand:+ start:1515 stop:2036 length:522 start_codon:yes stop_codon:yes gene_type:complete